MTPCSLIEIYQRFGEPTASVFSYRGENLHPEDRHCVFSDITAENPLLIVRHTANEILQRLQKVYLRSQNVCLTPSAMKADVCVGVVATYGARGAGYRFGSGGLDSCSLAPAWTCHTGGRTGGCPADCLAGWLICWSTLSVSLTDMIFVCLNFQQLNVTFHRICDLSLIPIIGYN